MPSTRRPQSPLHEPYLELKEAGSVNLSSATTSERLIDLVRTSLRFLNNECIIVDLTSRVAGKNYFSYANRTTPHLLSRPINSALYNSNEPAITAQWNEWILSRTISADVASLLYTMAIAYGAASDLFDRNNKKGP